jgi:hypothetical protein
MKDLGLKSLKQNTITGFEPQTSICFFRQIIITTQPSWLENIFKLEPYIQLFYKCTNIQPNGDIICYILSGLIFRYEFNGDICFMIRLTIYGSFSSMDILYIFWTYFLCEFNYQVYSVIKL